MDRLVPRVLGSKILDRVVKYVLWQTGYLKI